MKIKSMVAAAAIVLFSFGALAANHNLGALGPGDTYLSLSETSNVVVAHGDFRDFFYFSLPGGSLDASAGTLNFGKFTITDTSFSYTLFTSADNSLGTGTNDTGFAISGLEAGSYYLDVRGTATGSKGGQYNGVLTTTVPEPETFAMLLAGLGLIGTIGRRRSIAAANA